MILQTALILLYIHWGPHFKTLSITNICITYDIHNLLCRKDILLYITTAQKYFLTHIDYLKNVLFVCFSHHDSIFAFSFTSLSVFFRYQHITIGLGSAMRLIITMRLLPINLFTYQRRGLELLMLFSLIWYVKHLISCLAHRSMVSVIVTFFLFFF